MIVLDVLRAVDEYDWMRAHEIEQLGQLIGTLCEFGAISPFEFREPRFGILVKPLAQRRARRNILQPGFEWEFCLLDSARPESVDEEIPRASRRFQLINPRDGN